TNNGPNAASSVVLTDTLPTGSSFTSITQTAGSDTFAFNQSGGTVTASASAGIAPNSSDTFRLVVFAPATLPPGANFSNTASASSSTFDPNNANNTATAAGSITGPPADLAVSNTGTTTAVEGANVTYTVTVSNSGPNPATGVVLTDTLGANLKFVSATTTQGSFSQSGGVVTFNVGTIGVSGSVTLTVTAQALEDGTRTNSANVPAPSADPVSSNNSAVANTSVSEPAIIVSAPITTTSRTLSNVVVATFTHASGVEAASAFKATINWGDGTTSTGTVTLTGSNYTVRGSHRYSRSGTRTVTTTVTEIGSAAELLLGKIGDEVPGLPDRVHGYQGLGTAADNQNDQGNMPTDLLAALFTEDTTRKPS